MRIYLLKTPEFSEEQFQNVYNFLKTFKGPLKFSKINLDFDKEKFPFLFYPYINTDYKSDGKKGNFKQEIGTILRWKEIFSLSTYYRDTVKINKNDFVIVLTDRRNELNWFSKFDEKRNIFVHTSDWDAFTNANPKYPIAYQIVENVMQFLMKLESQSPYNPYIHFQPTGCMNDFCQNKQEVILKLQNANICETCIAKIRHENIDNKILQQVYKIFDGVRNELVYKNRTIEQNADIKLAITVTKKNEIFIGNLEIRLTPLRKTLYLFFLENKLINNHGILFNDLGDFKIELMNIYRKLAVEGDMDILKTRINALVNPLEDRFSQEKSRINSIISDTLGKNIAKDYILSGGRNEPSKINISNDLIKFQQ